MDTGSNWFAPAAKTHAIVNGGSLGSVLHYVIESGGTSTTHGDMTVNRSTLAAFGSATRGFSAGGSPNTNVIDFHVFETAGNATDFGDRLISSHGPAGLQSDTRGVMACGYTSTTNSTMDFITMDTAGNAANFGSMYSSHLVGDSCNDTRGLFFGGSGAGNSGTRNDIHYITIATTGNSTDFGDHVNSYYRKSMGSSATRALIGGYSSDVIGVVTIATPANATTFGNFTVARGSSHDNGVLAIGVGGSGSDGTTTDQVTIATDANATSFNATMNQSISNSRNSKNSHVVK